MCVDVRSIATAATGQLIKALACHALSHFRCQCMLGVLLDAGAPAA